MKIFRKIDTTTGNFLEDVLFEAHPVLEDGELDPQYIEEAPKQGLYLPRYLNGVWIEGGVAPEPTTPQLSTDEKLTQMAEQLVIAQKNIEVVQGTLDFLLLGERERGE